MLDKKKNHHQLPKINVIWTPENRLSLQSRVRRQEGKKRISVCFKRILSSRTEILKCAVDININYRHEFTDVVGLSCIKASWHLTLPGSWRDRQEDRQAATDFHVTAEMFLKFEWRTCLRGTGSSSVMDFLCAALCLCGSCRSVEGLLCLVFGVFFHLQVFFWPSFDLLSVLPRSLRYRVHAHTLTASFGRPDLRKQSNCWRVTRCFGS